MEDNPELNRLFKPKSIAVIGATESGEKAGGIIFKGLLRSGCALYPVHPHEKEIHGVKAYNRIEELPDGIDIGIITITADKAVVAAGKCAEKRIPYIIILAGGFGETGDEGRLMEETLKGVAENGGSRILGPNSLGIFVPERNLDTIFVEHGDRALAGGGSVAFITQSGSVGVEALGLASNTGFGLRAFVGLGNKCDLSELDFLRYFRFEKETNCLAFYLEDLSTGRDFLLEAAHVSVEKPVIVLKAGRTKAGSSAVSSHTGRLAGSDHVVSGAFRQFGIQRAMDDEELCDASKVLSSLPPASGNRVAVLTPAGGYGVMCSDYIESPQRGITLKMAELSNTTCRRIRQVVHPYASVSNPVDVTASADNNMIITSLDVLLDDAGVDIIVFIAFFAPRTITDELIDQLAVRTTQAEKPIISFTQYGPFTDKYLRRMYQKGIIGFPSITRTVRAARFLVERAEILSYMGN